MNNFKDYCLPYNAWATIKIPRYSYLTTAVLWSSYNPCPSTGNSVKIAVDILRRLHYHSCKDHYQMQLLYFYIKHYNTSRVACFTRPLLHLIVISLHHTLSLLSTILTLIIIRKRLFLFTWQPPVIRVCTGYNDAHTKDRKGKDYSFHCSFLL